ncbi:MAG: hypothetical protein JHC74_04055 [Thermoleophilia bacterium]|nr:hypothetical protein [Thermoleophilia bacterium]
MGIDGAPYELASLGDLIELIVEGWTISRMHYADRSGPSGPPAAYFGLARGPDEWRGVFIPDDGRALSHRSLVGLFRDHPAIWKHRSSDTIAAPGAEGSVPAEEWGSVPDRFPDGMAFGPSTLREVVRVAQVQSIAGLDIALVALERHDSGARLQYMCHASDQRTRAEMVMLDVIAVDDAGRMYRVACVPSAPVGNRLDGTLVIAPPIPADVRRLTVTVGTVLDASEGRQTSGPWVFPIPLAPRE